MWLTKAVRMSSVSVGPGADPLGKERKFLETTFLGIQIGSESSGRGIFFKEFCKFFFGRLGY